MAISKTVGATVYANIKDKVFTPNDVVPVEIKVSDFTNITAYQFAVKFNTAALEYVGVLFPESNPLQLSKDLFGLYQISTGLIRHLWDNIEGRTLANDATLFTLVFKAKTASTISKEVSIPKCCLNPPLNPMAYRYKLIYSPFTFKINP